MKLPLATKVLVGMEGKEKVFCARQRQKPSAQGLGHHRLGLDCVHQLEWRNWKPGGEYTRSLVLKNVSTKTIQCTYKLPGSKHFSMDFPVPKKLCAGMSLSIKIIFRPIREEEYHDFIEIISSGGSFKVPVVALTPERKLEMGSFINFGFVPALEVQTQEFHVTNTGDTLAMMRWKINSPFSIEPSSAHITPGEKASFTAYFHPMDASVFMATAICELGGGPEYVVKVSGISKYPYLSLGSSYEDFGEVLVGQSAKKSISISNFSEVDANFTILHDGDEDNAFSVTTEKKSLSPHESTMIHVTYTPSTVGTCSLESFEISTRCGKMATLRLQGQAAGSIVRMSSKALAFGEIHKGKKNSRVLYIENTSKQKLPFQMITDPFGIFSFECTRGIIPPASSLHITITFQPHEEANYWKRVTCLFQDTKPASIDLYGTCFSEKARPPTLAYHHIERNLGDIAVRTDMEISEPLNDTIDHERVGTSTTSRIFGVESNQAGRMEASEANNCWEAFFSHERRQNAVYIDVAELDFGSCSRFASGEYKSIILRNTFNKKVTAFMSIPLWEDPSGMEDPQRVVEVFPSHCDIKPGGEASFRVVFRPTKDACYYHSVLDLFVYVKSMRNFRLVQKDNIIPPWNFTIQVTGDTFLHRTQDASPKVKLSTTRLVFPPTHVGEPVYQTLMLVNSSDTPVCFQLPVSTLQDPLAMKPTRGVIPPHSQQLVGFKFAPSSPQTMHRKVLCVFNNAAMNAIEIYLKGVACVPELSLSISGALFFKPTCVGTSSTRALDLINTSRVPVSFQWVIPDRIARIFDVHPPFGTLNGKETRTTTWKFSPRALQHFEGRVQCIVCDPKAPATFPSSGVASMGGLGSSSSLTMLTSHQLHPLSLVVKGEGKGMALKLDPIDIPLGTVVVFFPVRREICLMNQSDGVLQYRIECLEGGTYHIVHKIHKKQTNQGQTTLGHEGQDFEISADEPEGRLPARAFKCIRVTLRPLVRRSFDLTLNFRTSSLLDGMDSGSVRPRTQKSNSDVNSVDEKLAATHITASATFPYVQVTDLYSPGWSKPYIWEMMSAESLNIEAVSIVSDLEKRMEKLETEGKVTNQEVLKVLQPIVLNFGIAATGSSPVTVYFELTNPAHLPVVWELHSNEQPEIEVEQWVEPVRPMNEQEKLIDFIVENNIFTIEPRSGELMAGGRTVITMVYTPLQEGVHSLPILLKIRNGKRICLQLEGKTVLPEAMKVGLVPSTEKFVLQPMQIGHPAPPMQMYGLRNGGPAPLSYELDLSSLKKLSEESFDFEIFQFSGEAKGDVPPRGVQPLMFKFCPLEAKVYTLDIPVLLKDGSSEWLKIEGRGYHVDDVESPEPLPGEGHRIGNFPGHELQSARVVMSNSPLTLSEETIWFGNIPVKGVSRRVIEITSQCFCDVCFKWQLGAFEENLTPASGRIIISPTDGCISPGESLTCRLDYEAGLDTEIFDIDIILEATPVKPHSDKTSSTGANEEADQLVAVDPPRNSKYQKGTLLRDRLAVHEATTLNIRNRLTPIKLKHAEILRDRMEKTLMLNSPPDVPQQELFVVTARGCVKTQDEVKGSRETWIMPMDRPWSALEMPESSELSDDTDPVTSILQGALSEAVCDSWTVECLEKVEYEQPTDFLDLQQKARQGLQASIPVESTSEVLKEDGEAECPEELGGDMTSIVHSKGAEEAGFQSFVEFVTHSALLGLLQDGANAVKET